MLARKIPLKKAGRTIGGYDDALAFAVADYRWRRLAADPGNWTEPARTRALAAAFLTYHSSRLALESVPGDAGRGV